jgi:tRNA (guanine37-N1)-methyltransferase
MWHATVLTIFPDMFPGPLGQSLAGKALATGIWRLEAHDIRTHATDRHRTVDDTPAGGGPGMVMKADVLARAIDAALTPDDARPRLLMSPRGTPLTQARVSALARGPGALIVCGRFEGIDERVIEARGLEEISVGDYVLSGGEIAAFSLIDACVRLLPGVMGKEASAAEESFAQGLLEYPHYTRPQLFEGRAIPDVLLGGDHARIAEWRRAEGERLTCERRPDLWEAYVRHLKADHGSAMGSHAVVLVDPEGIIRLFSPGAERLLGHDAKTAVGQTLDLIVPPDYRERHWHGFRAAIANGRPQYEDAAANIPILCRDGTVVRFAGRLIFLRNAYGQAIGAMGIFRPKDGSAEPPLPDL